VEHVNVPSFSFLQVINWRFSRN